MSLIAFTQSPATRCDASGIWSLSPSGIWSLSPSGIGSLSPSGIGSLSPSGIGIPTSGIGTWWYPASGTCNGWHL